MSPQAKQAAATLATFPTPARIDGRSGRFYDVQGEGLMPSVTNILGVVAKPALINWAASTERIACLEAAADLYTDLVKTPPMSRPAYVTTLQSRLSKTKAHKRELEKAGEIGTQVHALIEWNLRQKLGQKVGPEPRVVDDAQWAFMAYEDWAGSVALKPLFIEQIVFSTKHRYAGTMDLLAEVNGVPTLIDFKTGKAIYSEAYLQSVAYQAALAEMGHTAAQGGLIVRLPKTQTDPAFEVGVVPPVQALFSTFLAVKEVWEWAQAEDEKYREKVAQRV